MKLIFSLCLFLLSANCLSVSSSDICTCTTIVAESDCQQKSDCNWDSTNKKCTGSASTSTVVYYSKVCTDITDAAKCTQSFGCAYVDKKCVIFSDCISYQATSNGDCQKYSLRCNWHPTNKYCVEGQTCSEYGGEGNDSLCAGVLQPNNTKFCKFDTTAHSCAKLTCEDFTKTTDADCAAVLSDTKCLSDKITCLTALKACASYTVEQCLNATASNGPCEVSTDATQKCQQRTCKGATTEFQTADKCTTYKAGCKFNGKACADAIVSCTTQTKDDCTSYIGTSGQCILITTTNPQTCGDPVCTDYTLATDAGCKSANTQLNCITNGYSCVTALEASCAAVTVTDGATCGSIISKQGKCKAPASGTSCDRDPCAGGTGTTLDQCSLYSTHSATPSIVCVTNGVNCLVAKQCTEYVKSTDAPNNCSSITGSDGACKDDSTAGATNCLLQTCDDITAAKSDADCQKGNSTCHFFDGLKCVSALKDCITYTSDCEKINATGNKKCVLDSTSTPPKCVTLTCATAPATTTTDEACNTYLPGCKTNGQGCALTLSACSSYQGVQSECEKHIGSDGKCTGTTTSGLCIPKDCINQSATTDDACKAYSPICLYSAKTKKCAKAISSCASITDQDSCIAALTSETGRQCQWNSSTKCSVATCSSISTGGSDDICKTFSATCKSDGKGCYDSSNYQCSDIREKNQCTNDTSGDACVWDNNKQTCFQFNKCVDYTFDPPKDSTGKEVAKTQIQLESETDICKAISSKCYSDGKSCVPYKPCTAITTKDACIGSKGLDGTACGFDTGASKCQAFGKCADVKMATDADCKAYGPTCTTDGTTCTDMVKCEAITDQAICANVGGTDGLCAWNETKCALWQCTDGKKITHTDCQSLSNTCTSDGTTCIDLAACSSYASSVSCVIGLGEKNTKLDCMYDTTQKACRAKACADYINITKASDCTAVNCAFDSTKKVCTDIADCSKYDTQDLCSKNPGTNSTTCLWATASTSNSTSTCIPFTGKCTDAANDQSFCDAQTNACYYLAGNGTATGQCLTMDCRGGQNLKASNSTGCQPVTSKDGKTLTFCSWSVEKSYCVEASDAKVFDVNSCFKLTKYTYYWNTVSMSCASCKAAAINTTNNTNTTNNSTNNTGTTNTTSSQSKILSLVGMVFITFMQ